MKKTMILGAAALLSSALLLVSCNNSENQDAANAETTEATETAEAVETENIEYNGTIVYFNLDETINAYNYAKDLGAEVEKKATAIQNEINRRGKKLENAGKDFNNKVQKGLMTRSVAETKAQELSKQEAEFQQYVATKDREMQEEQMVMMNQIADAIQTYVTEYNKEKKYSMILTNQAGNPVIIADPALNITAEIIEGLNKKYAESNAESAK